MSRNWPEVPFPTRGRHRSERPTSRDVIVRVGLVGAARSTRQSKRTSSLEWRSAALAPASRRTRATERPSRSAAMHAYSLNAIRPNEWGGQEEYIIVGDGRSSRPIGTIRHDGTN